MTCRVQPKRRVSLGCLSVLPLSAWASAHQNAAAKSSDEVSFGCWESNADVKAWMAKHAMGTNLTLLNNYYMSNLLKIIKGTMNKTAMFWRPGAADSLPQTEVPAGEPPRAAGIWVAFFSTRATISLLAGTVFDVYGAATKVPGAEDYGSTISLTTVSAAAPFGQPAGRAHRSSESLTAALAV